LLKLICLLKSQNKEVVCIYNARETRAESAANNTKISELVTTTLPTSPHQNKNKTYRANLGFRSEGMPSEVRKDDAADKDGEDPIDIQELGDGVGDVAPQDDDDGLAGGVVVQARVHLEQAGDTQAHG